MSFAGPAAAYTLALTVGVVILAIAVFRRHSSMGYCLLGLMGMMWLINALNIPDVERALAQRSSLETVILKDLAMIAMLVIINGTWAVAGYSVTRWTLVTRWVLPAALSIGKVISWADVRDRCVEPIGYTFDQCAIGSSTLYAVVEGGMYLTLLVWLIITFALMYRGGDLRTPVGLSVSLYLAGLLVCALWVALAAVGVVHIAIAGHLPPYQLTFRPIIATASTIMVLLAAAFFPSYLTTSRTIFQWRIRKAQEYLTEKVPAPDRIYDSATVEAVEHFKLALQDEGAEIVDGMSHSSAQQAAHWLMGEKKPPAHIPLARSRRAQRRWLLWVALELRKLEKASLSLS